MLLSCEFYILNSNSHTYYYRKKKEEKKTVQALASNTNDLYIGMYINKTGATQAIQHVAEE